MRERSIQKHEEQQKQLDAYVKQTAGGGSAADEVAKLAKLRDEGTITAEEFEREKAKALG
jgi:hypothetical protein